MNQAYEGLIGLGSFLGIIFSVIVFCIFCGMFRRLGRIERVLRKMAVHQGAARKEDFE